MPTLPGMKITAGGSSLGGGALKQGDELKEVSGPRTRYSPGSIGRVHSNELHVTLVSPHLDVVGCIPERHWNAQLALSILID